MDSSDDRIVIANVNVPGSTTRVSKVMYDAMKQAMWKVLPVYVARFDPKRSP